jgi:hypothetical protein
MANEILSVPEENLAEVIIIIRKGMYAVKKDKELSMVIKKNTLKQLTKWCDEEETYLERR